MHTNNEPQISVIIPCYNHGKFLKKAVESIRCQNIVSVEIIVVDDGSTDDTAGVAKELGVRYIRQENSGLSSARNTGIKHCNGDLLVFLDADDWLLPGSLRVNAEVFKKNSKVAYVFGAHEIVFVKEGITREIIKKVEDDHYLHLLQGNYIGMHAAVMYRRWVFDEFLFDTSLKMCEDYDMYLRVSRKYPVIHHTKKIAAYRIHDENMSGNIPKMLNAALHVLKRQSGNLSSKAEKKAYRKGKKFWKNYYTRELYIGITTKNKQMSIKALFCFLKYAPVMIPKIFVKKYLFN